MTTGETWNNTPDWPGNIPKPALPEGYEWVCLRPALGLGTPSHRPWWIRALFTTKRGHKQHVKIDGHFSSPDLAIRHALTIIGEHHARRAASPPTERTTP